MSPSIAAGPASTSLRVSIVTTTVADPARAQQIAQALVQDRLAACVQIEPITSVYRWAGAVHQDAEQRLVCKTSPQALPRLLQALQARHPYEVPQVLVREEEATAAYAAWVVEETGG